MKKIHITESQLRYCLKKLNEAYQVDVTDDFEAGQTPSQVVSKKKAENPTLASDSDKGEVAFTFNPNGIDEGCDGECGNSKEFFTKKQIKEAKLRKLKENCQKTTKSEIKKSLKK